MVAAKRWGSAGVDLSAGKGDDGARTLDVVLAHAGQVDLDVDAMGLQVLSRAHAREHQDLGRPCHARAQDHLTVGPHLRGHE